MTDNIPVVNRKRWRSAVQIARDSPEDASAIEEKLKEIRSALVNDLVEQLGLRTGDAIEAVTAHLIGVHPSRLSVSSKALRASPEAIRLLHPSGAAPSLRSRPEIESGWKSLSQLSSEFKGSLYTIQAKTQHIKNTLIQDIVDQLGLDNDEAALLVEKFIIGHRAHPKGGSATTYVSPTAIQLLESTGLLSKRPFQDSRQR